MGTVRVGVELGAPGADPGGWLAEATAYEAAGVDSLWVAAGDDDPWVLLGALAAVTWRVRLGAPRGAVAGRSAATVESLGAGRLLFVLAAAADGTVQVAPAAGGAVERWVRALPLPGRRPWSEAVAAAAAAGADGMLVPARPSLLDLLRNPDEEDDRSDLRLTYG